MGTHKPTDKFPPFPLWLHPSGQWCRKHKGKFHYFGTDRDEALKTYAAEWEDRKAGRRPKRSVEGLTVADLLNHFLTSKRERVTSGELTARSWSEYHRAGEEIVASLGKGRLVADVRPEDFAKLRNKLSKTLGPVALGNFIQRVRTIFKYGFDAELVDVPVRFGPGFAKPPRRTIRLLRAKRGPRMIPATDILRLAKQAGSPLDAMIWLGINCGFGQTDCSELPKSALDRPGWIDFHRPKTGAPRRAPLWPETVAALNKAIATRPQPADKGDDGLVFLTRFGRPFVRFSDHGNEKRGARTDGIGQEFNKLIESLKLQTPGGFYTLRHVHRTVADEVKDRVAADLIMGHVDDSIAGMYREVISDERLKAITDHVHGWLMQGREKASRKGRAGRARG